MKNSRWIGGSLGVALALTAGGCRDRHTPTPTKQPTPTQAPADDTGADAFPEFQHEPPQNEGMPIADPAEAITSAVPRITVGQGWTDPERPRMTALVNEAVAILTDPQFRANGTAINAAFPKVWLSQALGYGDAVRATNTAGSPQSPIRYVAASVIPTTGGASTGGYEGRLRVNINRKVLERWQSPDAVMRACAVNTVAHEITHTLSRSATRFLYAFTDTGVGSEARAKAPASYLSGNIALCEHLVRNGRITREAFGRCVPIWYRPKGFQAGKCDNYPGNTPVQ